MSGGRNTPPPRSRTPLSGPSTPMPQSQVIAVKGVEPKLVQIIMDEIVEGGAKVQWTDIAGQEVSCRSTTEFLVICVRLLPSPRASSIYIYNNHNKPSNIILF